MQPLLLLGFCLRLVFVQQFERLLRLIAVEDGSELVDGGGHFEAEVEDLALALETDVGGPFDHAREVAAGLDVLADAEVAGAFFDEGVLGMLLNGSLQSLTATSTWQSLCAWNGMEGRGRGDDRLTFEVFFVLPAFD